MQNSFKYLVAASVIGVAVLVRWLLDPWMGNFVPFATLYGAVAFSVWYGGYRAGIAATVLGYFLTNFLFIEPRYSLAIASVGNQLALILYLSTSGIIVGVTESMQRAQHRAERNARELQVASETICRQAALAQAINDNTAELIFMKDRAGRLTYTNAATLRVIGMKVEQAIGSVDHENFTKPSEHLTIANNDRLVAETGESLRVEEVYTDPRGNEHVFLSTKSPLRNEQGEVTGVIGVALDITERKRYEKELEGSQRTLSNVVERCPFGIYIVDADFCIAHMNEESQKGAFANVRPVLGRRFDEAIRILWPEPVATDVIEKFQQTLATGESFYSKNFMNPRADINQTESYEWELHRITLSTGRPGVVCYYFNSTKLRHTEDALREAREQLAAELSAMTRLHSLSTRLLGADDLTTALNDLIENAVVASKADFGNIQLVNLQSGALEIVAQQGFQQEFLDHFRSVTIDDGSACAEAMRMGARFIIEDVMLSDVFEPHRHVAAAAGYRGVQSTPLKDRSGNVIGMLSTHYREPQRPSERDEQLLDIYARHATDLIQRLRLEQALREADRRKDEFLATLAHELRNPMAPISTVVQLLGRMEPPYENLQPLQGMLERNVGHMIRLVDELMEVSRITTGKIELRRQRVNLADVVKNAIETSGPLIDAKRHELSIAIPRHPIDVEGDAMRLTQVVANLLNNAAKYTPDGGHLRISVEKQGSSGIIRVRDNGPGIPPEMLDKVFELFTQINDGYHRLQGGLGIGLALVKRLVKMHGGTVEAHRAAGGGAEFVVQLPLVSDGVLPVESDSDGAEEVGQARYRILIVDDNVDAADSLATLLSAGEHDVCTAHDGLAAIKRALTFNPNVILLDLGMPGMDGYETARKIRTLPGGDEIVIGALTGWGQEKDRCLTKEAGFHFHLVKPVKLRDLHSVLEEAISSKAQPSAMNAASTFSLFLENGDAQPETIEEESCESESKVARSSKVVHDLNDCFYGIRMAAEVLDALKFGEQAENKAKRAVASIQKDCERGAELTADVRSLLNGWDNEPSG